jgi:uncharacterized membrane protein
MSDAEPENRQREPVWSFRGYELGPVEFTNAMLQFYRGEQERSNTWRTRLDTTTYWAVITTLASVAFIFASPANHYVIILLAMLLVTLFLRIEARRYRYYELWSYRVRLMETDFFAAMLVPPFRPHPEWAENLAQTLLVPRFPISNWEAFGRRFRRNYMILHFVLLAAWGLHGYLIPSPAVSWSEFISRFALGFISGRTMILMALALNATLFTIGLVTSGMKRASGEVLPKYVEFPILGDLMGAFDGHSEEKSTTSKSGSSGGGRRRAQLLTLVISAKPEVIADLILKQMKRGVTELYGKGAYTQQDREVLMIAITVTEVSQLEQLVRSVDPNAFVIVLPAQEVLGRGFQPLINS